jgi:DNA repair protein RadC
MSSEALSVYETAAINKAVRILESRLSYHQEPPISSPDKSKELAFLKLGGKPDEHFACAFLTNRHQLISFEILFRGTVDGASVHPRVAVRRALELNAAAVIFAHNHPSGDPSPSQADQRITGRLKEALALVDVRVLDHLVVGSRLEETLSFAERGLI